ncbi:MAG: hypothetical protein V4726_02175 [Verrucomicrobiota bacterium]
MTKITLLTLALLGSGLQMSQAISVSVSKGLNPGFNAQSSGGSTLTTFNLFLGSFDAGITADTIKASGAGIGALIAASFNEYGTATAPANGLITGSFTKSDFTNFAATEFNGKNMFLIVTTGTTASGGQEYAILTTGATSPAETWVFPSDVTAPIGTTNAPSGVPANFSLVYGNLKDAASGVDTIQLVAIPEVSSSLLSGLAVLGLITRRKR